MQDPCAGLRASAGDGFHLQGPSAGRRFGHPRFARYRVRRGRPVMAQPPIQFDRASGALEGANLWERTAALALVTGSKISSHFSHRGYNTCATHWRKCCSRDAKNATIFLSRSPAPVQPSAPTGWPPRGLLRRGRTGLAAAPSPVDLSEHDIERTEDGRNVGQQMAPANEIHRLQMREARRT